MKRCEALKGDGSRCQARAIGGSGWCYNHDPSRAEERRRNARRGGRAGGRGRAGAGDLQKIRAELRGVLSDVLSGRIPPNVGSVLFTGYGVLLRAVETERRVHEQEVIEERLTELEMRAGLDDGGRTWAAR
jgi:hypothetical protein